MLCVAGDFNAHIGVVEPGDEESIGIFGWGTRNMEGRELVEMLRRNGLAVAGTFFQNKESHKITYRSGRHKTELDLLVVLFTRHGLNINLEKTEVVYISHQREELDIELGVNKLTQGDSFVYLGGAVCGDGKTEREVRRRAQAGANAWRAVEGVMADRRISKRLKGKIMSTCVTPACLYGTETLAMTELQQQGLQVCENN